MSAYFIMSVWPLITQAERAKKRSVTLTFTFSLGPATVLETMEPIF